LEVHAVRIQTAQVTIAYQTYAQVYFYSVLKFLIVWEFQSYLKVNSAGGQCNLNSDCSSENCVLNLCSCMILYHFENFWSFFKLNYFHLKVNSNGGKCSTNSDCSSSNCVSGKCAGTFFLTFDFINIFFLILASIEYNCFYKLIRLEIDFLLLIRK